MLVKLIVVGLAVGVLLGLVVRRSRASTDLVSGQLSAAERPATRTDPTDPALRREVEALLLRDRKIEAIKLVRERTGLGLKAAKDLVDGL